MTAPLLHLCAPGEWRAFLDGGAVTPASLAGAGFVHLSTPEQVALPAQRLFAGRRDLVLLVVDPGALDRAGVPVRWEPGVPGDPAAMRFPHAYGAVPATAVLAVLPYRPGPDGFAAPAVPAPSPAARAAGWEPSMLRRAADAEEPVAGGVAIRTSGFPASRMHNRLLLDRPEGTDAATVLRDAGRTLAAYGRTPAALLHGPGADALAAELGAAGWRRQDVDVLAGPAARDDAGRRPAAPVSEVDAGTVRDARIAGWRAQLPGEPDALLAQLVDRDAADARAVAVHHLAVLDDGRVRATATLRRDGATAWLDGVEVDPAHRGRGHGDAVLAASRDLAAAHGCDLVALGAEAGDWPRDWYLRRGFAPVGSRVELTAPG